MMNSTAQCEWCGEGFSPRQKGQLTCSNKCKLALRRAKISDLNRALSECFQMDMKYVEIVVVRNPAARFFKLLSDMGWVFHDKRWIGGKNA